MLNLFIDIIINKIEYLFFFKTKVKETGQRVAFFNLISVLSDPSKNIIRFE